MFYFLITNNAGTCIADGTGNSLDPINLLVLPVANRKRKNSWVFFIIIVQSNDFKQITYELVEARFDKEMRRGSVESVQYSHVTDIVYC